MNQCDGCQAKMPLDDGNRHQLNGRTFMGCEKEKYKETPVNLPICKGCGIALNNSLPCPYCRAPAAKETPVTRDDTELKKAMINFIRLEEEYRKALSTVGRLTVENEKLWAMNAEKANKVAQLEQKVLTLEGHKARYQEELLQLEQECETYRLALHKIAKTAEEVGLE